MSTMTRATNWLATYICLVSYQKSGIGEPWKLATPRDDPAWQSKAVALHLAPRTALDGTAKVLGVAARSHQCKDTSK